VETNDDICINNTFESIVKIKIATQKRPLLLFKTIPYTPAMV
jgi:hypothetical protein